MSFSTSDTSPAPGRLVPVLALWEVYTAARWLYGLRAAARRRHPPTRLVVSGDPIPSGSKVGDPAA